jgi:hypothetical protein
MSVSPDWRKISTNLIPERLRTIVPGARGSDSERCFSSGTGLFEKSEFTPGLMLIPDSPKHGVIAPTSPVLFEEYQAAIQNTRDTWFVDES